MKKCFFKVLLFLTSSVRHVALVFEILEYYMYTPVSQTLGRLGANSLKCNLVVFVNNNLICEVVVFLYSFIIFVILKTNIMHKKFLIITFVMSVLAFGASVYLCVVMPETTNFILAGVIAFGAVFFYKQIKNFPKGKQ